MRWYALHKAYKIAEKMMQRIVALPKLMMSRSRAPAVPMSATIVIIPETSIIFFSILTLNDIVSSFRRFLISFIRSMQHLLHFFYCFLLFVHVYCLITINFFVLSRSVMFKEIKNCKLEAWNSIRNNYWLTFFICFLYIATG